MDAFLDGWCVFVHPAHDYDEWDCIGWAVSAAAAHGLAQAEFKERLDFSWDYWIARFTDGNPTAGICQRLYLERSENITFIWCR
jgi:hypothetical protein